MKYKAKYIQIACDGGASTGKSTAAKLISKKYKLKFLSSGLLYRYASYLILRYKPADKINFLNKKFKNLNYNKLNNLSLHSPEISNYSAKIAKFRKVRLILKKYQVAFANKYGNCCIEGRDIATKILPNANIKFFFRCDLSIAAKRRYLDLKKLDPSIKLINVKKALRLRNISDTNRKNSPLLKHRDSVVIDTGKLNITSVIDKMTNYIERIIN